MWFRCSGGNGTGGGATITVTYSSQFYNKTMTCSKGLKTYTKTTTSSGSTVFDVDESGTWTITCDGVSRTVDVVLEYSTQMAITKTITVYSAASDTVSFTDVTGAKTVTTDANGQGSVNITFIPPSASITFTSSVAKNPNDTTEDYSKTVTIDSNTSEIYLMPNNTLYWFGYNNGLEGVTSANGWSHSKPMIAPTFNTHDIDCTASVNTLSGIGSTNQITPTSNIVAMAYLVSGGAALTWLNQKDPSSIQGSINVTSGTLGKVSLNASTTAYAMVYASSPSVTSSVKVSAIWYE